MAAFTGTPFFDSEQVASIALWQSRERSISSGGKPVNPLSAATFVLDIINGRGQDLFLDGLEKTGRIGRVEIDPAISSRPGMSLATPTGRSRSAASSAPPTVETWNKVLFVDEKHGLLGPRHGSQQSKIHFAGCADRNSHFGAVPAGQGSGLFKSTDGGVT